MDCDTACSRRVNYEFLAIEKALKEKSLREKNPAKILLALKECRDADLHPLDLIATANRNWFGYIRTACKTPDQYLDKIRSYGKFVDEVVPTDPETLKVIERVVGQNV